MDPQDYRDARWFALLRAAADLGVPEEDAPALVEDVLARNDRRIRRADDPDQLVLEALRERWAAGTTTDAPARPRRHWRGLVALAVGLAVVALAVGLTRPERPLPDRLRSDQVPSLFGYDQDQAQGLLEDRGLRVRVEPLRACEVSGRVLASDPPAGTRFEEGDEVAVYVSVPADVACLTDYQDRVTAWQLIEFADGRGPAPTFDDRVILSDGAGSTVVLDRAEAADPAAWSATGLLTRLRTASHRVSLVDESPLTYAVPDIAVTSAGSAGAPPCGRPPTSAVVGSTDAFALAVTSPDGADCQARIEVYREDGAIVAIAYDRGSG